MNSSADVPRVTVSGAVESPDLFAQRFDQARRELEESGAQVLPRPVGKSEVEQRAEHLRRLHLTSSEPQLELGRGVRGRLVFNVKRTVRKLTRWYVEPHWAAQREFDAELTRFANDVSLQCDALERRVAHLEEWNGRLLRQVHLVDRTVRADEAS